MKPLDTTPEKVLREAIQSEVDTRAYYQMMATRAATPEVRTRLLQLADGELLHRAKLERKYRETIGHPAPPPAEPAKPELPYELQDLDMRQALKHALERERDSESHFRFLAERVPNTELGRLFMELAEMEWKHKTDLQAEYDRVAAEDFLADI